MTVTTSPCKTRQWTVEANPFSNLYVDLTERCNMACNYCCNPARQSPDLDLSYFTDVCRRLPRPVIWRFLGGEPTLHDNFFDFIDTAFAHGHRVQFNTNGLTFLDEKLGNMPM